MSPIQPKESDVNESETNPPMMKTLIRRKEKTKLQIDDKKRYKHMEALSIKPNKM